MEPPPFQEALRCDVCKCSFSTFRRRHHCRCCGRTLCADHSSSQMALPQFGIHSNVRVCADCFNDGSRLSQGIQPAAASAATAVNSVTDSISSLDIGTVSDAKADNVVAQCPPSKVDCKCGMPLCICQVPEPQSDPVVAQLSNIRPKPSLFSSKVKKPEPSTKSRGSTSNGRPTNSVFNQGQPMSSALDLSSGSYENTGEGLREAIKNGDAFAAKKLLSQGVDANYCDKQGSSLLHLAAVFNQTEIVFALIDHGASLNHKNSQGETPLDCAPAALQYKIKQRIEEDMKSGP